MASITTDSIPSDGHRKLMTNLFHALQGKWKLDRDVHDPTAKGASGKCRGVATFTSRRPTRMEGGAADTDEMVYHEDGQFTIDNAGSSILPLPFSRMYIWRVTIGDRIGLSASNISLWFTKPGTECLDYLFHKLSFNDTDIWDMEHAEKGHVSILKAYGSHPCVEDMYESEYAFSCKPEADNLELKEWRTSHAVSGPNKQQSIHTVFTKV